MAISENIYPPIVKDGMPAFLRNKPCKIYFSLSIYNTRSQLRNVQITLINQKTNKSALKYSSYPSGIKIGTIEIDNTVKDDYKYYTVINTSDLETQSFTLNQIYKVQLRFTSQQASNPPSSGIGLATWLFNNRDYFSEWSKICLIKGIQQPHIKFQPDWSEDAYHIFEDGSPNELVGKLFFSNSNEKEYLKSYNIKIYEKSTNQLKYDTGILFSNNDKKNQIYCLLEYDFQENVRYKLNINYTTNNLYNGVSHFEFSVNQSAVEPLDVNLTATPDEANARILLHVKPKNNQPYLDKDTIVFRRSSSLSNFTLWNDIQIKQPVDDYNQFNYFWNDMTIESGIWYKYRIQRVDSQGRRGPAIETEPVMCIFEDIYLTQGNIQLRLQFNPTVGQFKYNVTESQQVTIGSKFPFIRRNGNNYYRTFSISGLISSFSDFDGWQDPYNEQDKSINNFTSKEQIYKDYKHLYDEYNEQHNISQYRDFIYERMFREKVMDFLYANDVKLFRSTTQGNILVKITNVNFQPNAQLGRMLYSFSATAVEIDDPTLKNYIKYNLISDPIDIVTVVRPSSFITFDLTQGILVMTRDGIYDTTGAGESYLLELEQEKDETKIHD